MLLGLTVIILYMEAINIGQRPYINYGSDFNSDLVLIFKEYNFSGKKIFLITGASSFRQTEYYMTLNKVLAEAGIQVNQEIQVNQNPTWDSLNGSRNTQDNADIILCVGGGSVIDFGKTLKLHFNKNAEIFVIYTFPGSSSIVTPFTIYDNHEFKIGEYSEKIIPNWVYIPLQILEEIPISLVHSSIFDIFCHAAESRISEASTEESRQYASKSLKFLADYVSSDYTDHLLLVKADIFSGLSEGVGLVLFPHAAGHYLTYKYKIPHRLASAYFLESFLSLLKSKGFKLPDEITNLFHILNDIFLKEYKKSILLSSKEISDSYTMARKYMPFIFSNSPVPFAEADYTCLHHEYENN